MSKYDPNLPDILRPTELADFGDIFNTTRRVKRQVFLIVLLLVAPMIARLHALTTEAISRAASHHPTAAKS